VLKCAIDGGWSDDPETSLERAREGDILCILRLLPLRDPEIKPCDPSVVKTRKGRFLLKKYLYIIAAKLPGSRILGGRITSHRGRGRHGGGTSE